MKNLIFAFTLFLGWTSISWSQNIIDTIFFEDGGIDAYTKSTASTTNFGTDTCLRVFWDYGSPTISNYSYLKADFSGIPSSAIVADASIHLYALQVNNSADHTMSLQRLTTSWTETGITWTTYPNATSVGAVTMSNTATSVAGWQDYDMTAIARYQVTNPTQNFGYRILLNAQSGTVDKGVIYASTENSNANIRPYVVVEYYLPQTDTIYFENTKDARVYSGATTSNFGTDSVLAAYWDYGTNSFANRAFLYADLRNIPKDAAISRANLYMYALSVNNSADHPLYVEAVSNASWTENGITWANQPTVGAAYRSGITQAQTSATGWHTMSVINLAKYAVWSPEKNLGWRVALQGETGTLDKGIFYASGEHSNSSLRPYLVVEYFDPIVISGYVTHCGNGRNDGAITPEYSGGASLYTNYLWRKLESGALTNVESGTDMTQIGVSGLSDGLYLLEITDYCGIKGYQYFFVGEEGTTTNVAFAIGSAVYRPQYIEDAYVAYNKSTGDSSIIGGSVTTVGCYTNTSVNSSSLVTHKVSWDPSLNFSSCRLAVSNKGGCYQTATSDNDAWVSRVIEPWGEMYTTWSTRPDLSTTDRVSVPTTTVNGYESRNDTFNILQFVPYWQEFPDENYGVGLSLKNYNQPTQASRDYNSSDQGVINLMVSFTVKPKIETFYYDSLDAGHILINAPAGELPYSYLISTLDTVPILDSIWFAIKDLAPIDSASFYRGKSNTRNFTYSNLPVDRYFIAVYDNNGNKIMDGMTYIKPPLRLKDTTDIVISGDTLSVLSSALRAKTIYFGQISNEEVGGFEAEVIQLSGEVTFGFNKWEDAQIVSDSDFEYAILVKTNGDAIFLKDGVGQDTFSVAIGDQIRIINEYGEINAYKNGVLQSTIRLNASHENTWKIEVNLKGPVSAVAMKPYASTKPKQSYKITHPTCVGALGNLLLSPSTFFGYSMVHYTLVNALTSEPPLVSAAFTPPAVSIPNIPAGIYNLNTVWSNGTSPDLNLTTQLYFGFVVDWINEDNIIETPLNTIKAALPSLIDPATANSANSIEYDNDYWIRFEPLTPNLMWQILFEVKNNIGEVELRIVMYQIFGAKYITFESNTGVENLEAGLPYSTLNDVSGNPITLVLPVFHTVGPFIIQHDAGNMSVSYQNNELVSYPTSETGDMRVYASMYGKAGVANTFASFCYAVNGYIAKTKPFQDGSYYMTKQEQLEFQYTGEYNTSDLIYSLTDESGDLVASTSYSIAVMGGTGSLKTNADNRYVLDMTSLSPGYYLLTVTNVKGEKHYIRIKN